MRLEVTQRHALRVTPQSLDRIEIGSVGGQVLDVEPIIVLGGEQPLSRAMYAPAIPDQDDRPAQLTMQLPNETVDVGRDDVARLHVKIAAHAMACGRQRQSGDRRQPVVAMPDIEDWSLPARRP